MYVVGIFGDFATALGAPGSQIGGMASLDLVAGKWGLGRILGLPQHDFYYFPKMLG